MSLTVVQMHRSVFCHTWKDLNQQSCICHSVSCSHMPDWPRVAKGFLFFSFYLNSYNKIILLLFEELQATYAWPES